MPFTGNVASRQMLVNSADVTAYTTGAGNVLPKGNVKIEQIEYSDYDADTNIAIVTDMNNKLVCVLNGASDLQTVRTGKIGWVSGLKVTKLDGASSRLFIYLH